MVGRMRRGKSPFHPDKTHIHHKFLALGFTHRRTMVTILLIAMGYVVLTFALSCILNINIVVLIDIIVWTAMHLYLNRKLKRKGLTPLPHPLTPLQKERGVNTPVKDDVG